jgi:hypothetical protein
VVRCSNWHIQHGHGVTTRSPNGYQISRRAILFVFALGGCPLLFFIGHVLAVRQAEYWPFAEAIVLRSQALSSTNFVESDYGTEVAIYTTASFAFNYAVTNHQYVSGRFYLIGQPPAHLVVRDYPPGRRFKARYNPSAPGLAIVEPGPVYYRSLIGSAAFKVLSVLGIAYNFSQK